MREKPSARTDKVILKHPKSMRESNLKMKLLPIKVMQ